MTLEIETGKIAQRDPSTIGVLVQLQQLSADVPEEFHEVEKRAAKNGYGLLKQVLVDALMGKIAEGKACDVHFVPVLPLLTIEMNCGNMVVYHSYNEIPEESVPCPCGDLSHWFIKYQDLRNVEKI